MPMPLMLMVDEPLLLSVTDLPPPVLPTATFSQLRKVGDAVAVPVDVVPVPIPETAIS
jgi:hypothetical protein